MPQYLTEFGKHLELSGLKSSYVAGKVGVSPGHICNLKHLDHDGRPRRYANKRLITMLSKLLGVSDLVLFPKSQRKE